MQRVKVVVDSFAFGASVTSLEGVGKQCENTRERCQVRTKGWQTATKRKGRMANDRSQKRQQSEQTVHQFFSWSNGIWYGSRPATPGAAARCLSAWHTWSECTISCLCGMQSGAARCAGPRGFPRTPRSCAD